VLSIRQRLRVAESKHLGSKSIVQPNVTRLKGKREKGGEITSRDPRHSLEVEKTGVNADVHANASDKLSIIDWSLRKSNTEGDEVLS
jgi:hypothetical protein